ESQRDGDGGIDVARDHGVDEPGAREEGGQGEEQQESRPDNGVAPVPWLEHPVPLAVPEPDDDPVALELDSYHSASLLVSPWGRRTRMTSTRTSAERVMNRGSPTTKHITAWVIPMR